MDWKRLLDLFERWISAQERAVNLFEKFAETQLEEQRKLSQELAAQRAANA